MANEMLELAKKLTNEQIALLLLPLTEQAMHKAEATKDPIDAVAAFALSAAGFRLCALADTTPETVDTADKSFLNSLN